MSMQIRIIRMSWPRGKSRSRLTALGFQFLVVHLQVGVELIVAHRLDGEKLRRTTGAAVGDVHGLGAGAGGVSRNETLVARGAGRGRRDRLSSVMAPEEAPSVTMFRTVRSNCALRVRDRIWVPRSKCIMEMEAEEAADKKKGVKSHVLGACTRKTSRCCRMNGAAWPDEKKGSGGCWPAGWDG